MVNKDGCKLAAIRDAGLAKAILSVNDDNYELLGSAATSDFTFSGFFSAGFSSIFSGFCSATETSSEGCALISSACFTGGQRYVAPAPVPAANAKSKNFGPDKKKQSFEKTYEPLTFVITPSLKRRLTITVAVIPIFSNIEKIKQDLMRYEIFPEDYGGKTVVCPISCKPLPLIFLYSQEAKFCRGLRVPLR